MSNHRATTNLPTNRSYLKGRQLIFPLGLATSLFFLWGFSYGILDVLNKHFQNVLKISKFESTVLQIAYFGGGYFCFSPIAAGILRKRGYKFTIVFGLILFALGAISYWPAIRFSDVEDGKRTFHGFVICTWIIASGLATLETSANSYVTLIGHPETASLRLQFCQSWNGVGSFLGPFIASNLFFSTQGTTSLTSVQYVYISVAIVALIVAVLFFLSKLPESINQTNVNVESVNEDNRSFWKQYNMIFAFLAIFCYVGAQVSNDSFFINYTTENTTYDDQVASRLLSYALIILTIGRFVGTILVKYFYQDFILTVYALIASLLIFYVAFVPGRYNVFLLMAMYFFESIMFPMLFVLGTENVGRHAHRAAGFLIMGISGGAVFPPIQGSLADSSTTRQSFIVPGIALFFVHIYALGHWIKNGFKMIRTDPSATKEDVRSTKPPITTREENVLNDSSPFLD